jgi:YidC/Oxa1 family membrane protein insertase
LDRNLFLAFALSFLVLLGWQLWVEHQHPPHAKPAATAPAAPAGSAAEPPAPGAPAAPVAPEAAASSAPAAPTVPAGAPGRIVVVKEPLYEAELSTHGGALVHWRLTRYFDASVPAHPPVELTTAGADGGGALVTPFDGLGLGDLREAEFRVSQPAPGKVVFEHAAGGITVRKTYLFDADSYTFRLQLEVVNGSSAPVAPELAVQWIARERHGPDFADYALAVLHNGEYTHELLAAIGLPGFFARLSGATAGQRLAFGEGVDWGGAVTRYFVAALIPEVPREARAELVPLQPGKEGMTHLAMRAFQVPPGQTGAREFRGYIGPKESDRLAALGVGLERAEAVGYWWVAPLTRGFAWLLHVSYSVIPNYGVAIILLTVLVRLVTAPLTARQMRSMRRMSELQPKIKALQAQYKDDRQALSQEMMKVYRESGANPLGGCLPMLVQFPVFIGLYYALQSSIDLRQAPFIGWIHDLSVPEQLFTIPGLGVPFRLLPIIMGASMVLQQKLTPSTMDPAQARMMSTVMPVMFTVLFYQFPSGLVLYWLVSNLLAIGHQFILQRELRKA